jgi:hypothetical protein
MGSRSAAGAGDAWSSPLPAVSVEHNGEVSWGLEATVDGGDEATASRLPSGPDPGGLCPQGPSTRNSPRRRSLDCRSRASPWHPGLLNADAQVVLWRHHKQRDAVVGGTLDNRIDYEVIGRAGTRHKRLGASEPIAPLDLPGNGLRLEKMRAGARFSEGDGPDRAAFQDVAGKAPWNAWNAGGTIIQDMGPSADRPTSVVPP